TNGVLDDLQSRIKRLERWNTINMGFMDYTTVCSCWVFTIPEKTSLTSHKIDSSKPRQDFSLFPDVLAWLMNRII
uniref:Uncharacterized protein n=1 Tax=Aegilops tauschii subsp. strangulata TaxID=200361 RepID=A0A453BRM9_AEGTS